MFIFVMLSCLFLAALVTTVDGQQTWTLGVWRCQFNMSIKIIQSRVGGRLVCSLPAYCVDVINATLRTVSVT